MGAPSATWLRVGEPWGTTPAVGGAFGTFVDTADRSDPQAVQFFNEWAWLLGSNPAQMHVFALWLLVGALAIASLFALVVLLAYVARPRECEYR